MASRRKRPLRNLRRKLTALFLPLVAPRLLRLLARTWTLEVLGRGNYDEAFAQRGRLVTLWHGRMMLPMASHPGDEITVLVSPSRDGKLAQQVLTRFGFGVIWGSSNRSASRALREMLGELVHGGTIVITPDGPRGPRHSINPGPAWMARATGFPILPVGCACDRAWRVNSWDRFTIPKPRARLVLAYEQPIYVPPDADDEAIAASTQQMRQRMIDAETRAFARLGVETDW